MSSKFFVSPFLSFLRSPAMGSYFLLNNLDGDLMLVTDHVVEALKAKDLARLSNDQIEYCRTRRYIFDDSAHFDAHYAIRRQHASDAYREMPLNILIVPTYACNFRCDYCFQKSIASSARRRVLSPRQLDQIVASIEALERMHGKPSSSSLVYVYGGEPLQHSSRIRAIVEAILDRFQRHQELFIITNGYCLAQYLPMLGRYHNLVIQVTLDGPAQLHDKRRHGPQKNCFMEIVDGTCRYLQETDNRLLLRINVDCENYYGLVDLRDLLQKRGLLGHERVDDIFVSPVMKRTAQLDYIPDAGADFQKMFIAWFHDHDMHRNMHITNIRGYQYAKRLFDGTGMSWGAEEFRCEALYGKYIFDPLDHVSVCEEACAYGEGIIGTYENGLMLLHSEWQARGVSRIQACAACAYRHACCGGCAWQAYAQTGDLKAACCDLFVEMLQYSLGVLYSHVGTELHQ
jgi:uncharacterized protein